MTSSLKSDLSFIVLCFLLGWAIMELAMMPW